MKILNEPFFDQEFTYEFDPNKINIFKEVDLEKFSFCKKNDIEFAIESDNIKDIIFAVNFGAKYIFCKNLDFARKVQKIVDRYLLDSLVVVFIENYDEIEEILKFGIDAVKLKER
jgi:hypothetical protein